MNSPVDSREWRWVIVGVMIILLLAAVPSLAGRLAQTEEMRFSGAVFDRQDYAVHLATMRLGASGDWAYRLRFTTEAHPGRYVKMGYLLLGKAAALLGLSMPLAYELARAVFGLGFLLSLYRLAGLLTDDLRVRISAGLLGLLGSGIGWLQLLLGWLPDPGISPIDFWLIDAYALFGLITLPHFALAMTCICLMIISTLAFFRRGESGWLLLIASFGAVIVAIQPSSVVIADLAVLGVVIGHWRSGVRLGWRSLLGLIAAGVPQVPLLAYNYWALGSHPVWAGFTAQNVTRSPPVIYFLTGFGLLWPLAAWGALISWRRKNSLGIALAFWMASALLLSYTPIPFQRRFSIGLSVPAGMLAGYGLWQGAVSGIRRMTDGREQGAWGALYARRGFMVGIILLFMSLSSLYLITGGALLASTRPARLFDPREVLEALAWIEASAGGEDAVFSSERTGLIIPARTGLRTFVGHPIETIDYQQKVAIAGAFYSPGAMTGQERLDVLLGCGCDWVFEGPYERLGDDLQADDLTGLDLVYKNPAVNVYRVGP